MRFEDILCIMLMPLAMWWGVILGDYAALHFVP